MKRFTQLFLLAAAVVCIHAPLGASPVPFVTGSTAGSAWNHLTATPTSCGYSVSGATGQCGYVSTGLLVENPSQGSGWFGLSNSFTAQLSSSADNNGLHARAQLDVFGAPLDFLTNANHYSSSYFNQGTASASFYDELTAQGPGGGSVDMVVTLNLDGNVYAFGSGSTAFSRVTFNSDYGSGSVDVGSPIPGASPAFVQQPLTFTFHNIPIGVSFYYTLQLDATVYVSDSISPGDSPKLSTTSAVADFSNTLAFSTIHFEAPGGGPLNGYTLDSISGYDYNQFNADTSSVPEPGSAGLALSGLLMTVASLRLRRRLKA